MALEEATTARLPFGMGEIDLTEPVAAVGLVLSLIAGATVWNMTDSIGARGASILNSKIGQLLGQNPATGESASASGGAFD